MVWPTLRLAAAACLLSTITGCAGPTGPIFGDWRGRQPTGDGLNPSFVDIVLYGRPGDTQGQYDFKATMTDPILVSGGNHTLQWGDRWTITGGPASGTLPILHLHDLPNSQIASYALTPNGVLIPTNPANQIDTSPGSLRYGLAPVPTSSRSYGRL